MGDFNFISGSNNKIVNNVFGSLFGSAFIGGGSGNTITSNIGSTLTYESIINGHDNTITADGVNIFNVNLFGSNLTAIDKNYSHFENLYVDGVLSCRYNCVYEISPTTAFTLNLDYSMHEFKNFGSSELSIQIPKGGSSIQLLSIIINDDSSTLQNIYFVDYSEVLISGFPFRQTLSPTQISSKVGFSTTANFWGNKCVTSSLGVQFSIGDTTSSYFFIWIPIIQKWVMYTSDIGTNSTF